ncbi:MAG: alpha-D-ribose 1-methylphosphonate 5-triphosphate diphosphatase [Gammaproteobacteria bacterium]|nr:alpha-D-ribose 1-methylphosphonate 5-triphosphate diphosphatase [Gammaproteobacteria bacterium]MCP5459751.1 alpha-D-ribose 1-methylphosphonate 5-triphosphate diphosphatase [Gammaproteobacteria bacterium]
MNELLLTNARIVTRSEVLRGTVRVADGRIVSVESGDTASPGARDWEGDYLLPGLVELHTDNLERHFVPRPGVRWPGLPAALAHDAQVAAAGITTVFDALALGDVIDGGDRLKNLADMAAAIAEAQDKGYTRAEHFLHLRCELNYSELLPLWDRFNDHQRVRLVSLMDHTPGQRQFARLDKCREYYQGKYHLDDAQMDAFIAQQQEAHARYSVHHRDFIARSCRERGLPLASHDDATRDHVMEAADLGMVIAEFPTTLEAAETSRERGLAVLMGAPNLLRGRSHSGNVAAGDLARAGLLDILSSDYYPSSLLQAAFRMHRDLPDTTLPAAIATVTHTPATCAGLHDRGEIAPGKRADVIRARDCDDLPLVREVWLAGRRVA